MTPERLHEIRTELERLSLWFVNEYHREIVRDLWRDYERLLEVERNCELHRKVSVHGTAPCLHCQSGNITVYAKERMCVECQMKREKR